MPLTVGDCGWAWRSLPLRERLGTPSDARLASSADRRLARWRSQPPFDQQAWWQARLEADGLDETLLLSLLAESTASLTDRLDEPDWLGKFSRCLLTGDPASPGQSTVTSLIADPAYDEETVFSPVIEPLLARARLELSAGLTRLTATERIDAFGPAELTAQLYKCVPADVSRMLTRTLVRELNEAREAGTLRGASPAQRFAHFLTGLTTDPGRRRDLFTRYPVLAQQLAGHLDSWVTTGLRFGAQLLADHAVIEESFGHGRRLGPVAEVVTGMGDRHRRGATVMRVTWQNGLELMYKPRPMAADAHFQQLLEWVNRQGATLPLLVLRCLDRGDHGWMEVARARPCGDDAARHRFYHRHGELLALLYLLNASDCHAGNIIASGEFPVVVDLETLLQPGLPHDLTAMTPADAAAAEAARRSVMATGLLPQRSWADRAGHAVDVSGLGWVPGQRSPLMVPTIRNSGQDTMRVELARSLVGDLHAEHQHSEHAPADGQAQFNLLGYAEDILIGFSEVYKLCAANKAEIWSGPLASFATDDIRVVLRPTFWYATILQTAFHPGLLRDGLDRDMHFDALWRDVPQIPALAPCITSERLDLWRRDIPVFAARADATVLRDSSDQPVSVFPLVPGMSQVRSRLSGLSPDDLARQRWLIAGALGTAVIGDPDYTRRPALPTVASDQPRDADTLTPAAPRDLVTSADTIGRELAKIAFQDADSAQWLGINAPSGQAWSMGPLRADLFHGLTGIALFLGWLGELTGDAAHTALAQRAIRTARHQLDQDLLHGFGGMAGLGGVIYGFCELAKLWQDEALLDATERYARDTIGHAVSDTHYDFVGGSAGTIAGLAVLDGTRPSAAVRDHIRACADRLLATSIRSASGIGWLPSLLREYRQIDKPIVGFAHGGAGIAEPLLRAASILGDERYHQAALDAISYGQALFDQATGTWLPPADPADPADQDAGEGNPSAYWCYGAAGIGLSRLLCLVHTGGDAVSRQEIASALNAVGQEPYGSQCLCHGDLGNVELYLQAAVIFKDARWQQAARQRAAGVVRVIEDQGYLCGMPLAVQVPSLMYGLAGIGYGLLRIACPQRTPAVLALQPSPASTSGLSAEVFSPI